MKLHLPSSSAFFLRQRGSAVLGVIVGVLVGLALALGVAMYVMKVPTPFNNKTQVRTPEQDVLEAKKNKDWNPNAALAGKTALKPPEAPASTASASGAVGALGSAAPSPSPNTATAPNTLPAQTGTAPVVVTPDASPELFNYQVQVGAFRSQEEADNLRGKLALQGIESKVTEREQSGRTVYRVRTGPHDKKDVADKLQERLTALGMESVLVRVQK